MEIFNITPQIMLVVIPADAALPSVLSTQAAVEGGDAEQAAALAPQTQIPLVQTLESVSVQWEFSEH